jgi:hypothetical protein
MDKDDATASVPDTSAPLPTRKSKGSISLPSPSIDYAKTVESLPADTAGEEDVTDSDGWIYGDNKWENLSGKGGIGKVSPALVRLVFPSLSDYLCLQYTRFRRWTRYAVLYETVETLSPSEPGSPVTANTAVDQAAPNEWTVEPSSPTQRVAELNPDQHPAQAEDGDRLRRRLRHALQSKS